MLADDISNLVYDKANSVLEVNVWKRIGIERALNKRLTELQKLDLETCDGLLNLDWNETINLWVVSNPKIFESPSTQANVTIKYHWAIPSRILHHVSDVRQASTL